MDKFRKEYRQLSDQEKALCLSIKEKASELDGFFTAISLAHAAATPEEIKDNARGVALARTKLEESVMWAIKAITG